MALDRALRPARKATLVCFLYLLPALSTAQPVPIPPTDTSASGVAQTAQWVFPTCFFAIFLGCAYLLWTMDRYVRWPRLCHLLGALTVVMSVVWTVINRTIDPEHDSRYPILSFWAMFAIVFVSESSIDIPGYILFTWTFLGFALILALTSFAVGMTFSLQGIPIWMVSHSKDAPLFFSLWACVVSALFHLPSGVKRWMGEGIERVAEGFEMNDTSRNPNNGEVGDAGGMAGNLDDV